MARAIRTTRKEAPAAPYHYQTVKLSGGTFSAKLPADAITVDAYYVPAPTFADCWSKTIKLGA